MKKITSLLLTVLLAFCMLFSMPFCANAASTVTQDGLEISIITDKDVYSSNEIIQLSIAIRNTNSYAINGVSIESILPKELKVKTGDLDFENISIPAGESHSATLVAAVNKSAIASVPSHTSKPIDTSKPDDTSKPADSSKPADTSAKTEASAKPADTSKKDKTQSTNSPKTGASSNIVLWVVLFVASCVATFFVIKYKKSANLLVVFLCVALILAIVPKGISSIEDVNVTTINLNKTITVASKSVLIEANVVIPNDELSSTCTISFDSNGGSPVASQTINKGSTATAPTPPVKDCFNFVGWYADAEFTTAFDFSKSISKSCTVFARWSANPSTIEIKLASDKTELTVDESGDVYFYATATPGVSVVSLYDAATDNLLIDLLDDGQFAVSGDDLPGDMIFSGKLTIDTTQEITNSYYAVANHNNQYTSETIQIKVLAGFTDDQIQNMMMVDTGIQNNIFSLTGFDDMSSDDKEELAGQVLNDMADQNLIEKETILYDENSDSYTFTYSSGVLGSVLLGDLAEDKNGLDRPAEDGVLNSPAAVSYNQIPANDTNASNSVGEAIVLWAFNQSWDKASYRVPFYENLESTFEDSGLDTTVDWDVTVDDYKNLAGYEVIMFSGHGSNQDYSIKTGSNTYQTKTLSSLLLTEDFSTEKDTLYDTDLKQFRVGKYLTSSGTKYAILPEFFNFYYDSDDLDGSFVFSETCEFYGKFGTENYQFATNLINASVEAVVGFHNSVMANYSRDMMKDYILNLIAGDTAIQAYNKVISVHGANDGQTVNAAYPIFNGNNDSLLINSLQNGDFELASTPIRWKNTGDVRVIASLGELKPVSKQKMAILTTGIGSAEDDYMAGTEGSIMYQQFMIPQGKTTLSFSYNVVSEEPHEYVGSQYNDTFIANLIVDGNTEMIATEEVNSAVWYPIDGIDFDGGDSTTYHTNWKTVEYDVSAYAGKVVTLRFVVYDMGDSIYDTVTLIDNVLIK